MAAEAALPRELKLSHRMKVGLSRKRRAGSVTEKEEGKKAQVGLCWEYLQKARSPTPGSSSPLEGRGGGGVHVKERPEKNEFLQVQPCSC